MRAGVVVAFVLVTGVGCALKAPTVPCTSPDDCLLPLVCCQGGLAVEFQGFSGPTCLSVAECTAGGGAFLQLLPAGSPCRRNQGNDPCRQGTSCCARTLTCQTDDVCAAAPLPGGETVAASACGADSDCASGGVCCDIDWLERDGTCASVRECAMKNGVDVPAAPDGGVVSTPDGGGSADLVEQICARAYCDQTGERRPNAAERAACRDAFAQGLDGEGRAGVVASAACLAAVEASRGMCPSVFRWRDAPRAAGVDRQRPVLPGPCYEPALVASPIAEQACARLVDCDVVPDVATCRALVAPLTHDALSRVATHSTCSYPTGAFGSAGRTTLGRCAVDGDCPTAHRCLPDVARGGVCTQIGCQATECGLAGGVCWQGLCTLECNPRLTSGNLVDAVRAQCAGRIEPQGAPVDMACVASVEGGRCAPASDLRTCAGGVEPLIIDGVRSWRGAYQCRAMTPGTKGRFERCLQGGDECAVGFCDSLTNRCSVPCVTTPVGVTGATCPAGELCVDPSGNTGWGVVGACMTDCSRNAMVCTASTTCQVAWPNRACL